MTAPTQTGLGERSHLLSKDITLDTFIDDIVNHLFWNDLEGVTLVGHSFGGVITIGVADRVPERLDRMVFLDGAIIKNGESWFSQLPKETADDRIAQAQKSSGGLSLLPASPQGYGITDPEQVAYLERFLTSHPLATCTTPSKLSAAPGNGLPVDYIACTNPPFPPAAGSHKRARDAGWPMHELATGHDAMITVPKDTADLLERIAQAES